MFCVYAKSMEGIRAQIFNRRTGLIVLITGAHVLALAGLLSLRPTPPLYQGPPVLEIELATLPPEPIAPLPEPEPEPELEPAPIVTQTATVSAPAPTPPTAEPVAPARETPTVLTQLGEAGPDDPSAVVAPADTPLTPGQIQHVLKQADCQKLTRQRDPNCATKDPFEVALASAARQSQAPEDAPDSPFATISDYDRLSYQVGGSTFQSQGMSSDLFVDPLAKGAYDARRIRNGQEPLWSDEMKDGFRKRD